MKKTFFAIYTLTLGLVNGQYQVSDATVEVYSPRGFKVSIPDEEGIKLFAFHGKINEEINREAGTFSQDILKAKDGRWTFQNNQAKLKIGDKLYFWTTVHIWDGEQIMGFEKDQVYEVKEYKTKPGQCAESKTTVNNKNQKICSGTLLFEEQFISFNSSKWNHVVKFGDDGPDYEFVIYNNKKDTIQFKNEKLMIKPKLTEDLYGNDIIYNELDLGAGCVPKEDDADSCSRKAGQFIIPPVVSSQITTKDKFSFKYGKIEVRAKLPKGNWIYPEIFLDSATEEYGENSEYLSGQIRVAYASGNMPAKLQGGVVLSQTIKGRTYGMKTKNNHERIVHNYGVNWSPDKITFTLDDMVYGEVSPPEKGFGSVSGILSPNYKGIWLDGSRLAPFDQEMYFTIGVGVGGHNFPDSNNKPWKNLEPTQMRDFYNKSESWYNTWTPQSALEVHHIKVWAL